MKIRPNCLVEINYKIYDDLGALCEDSEEDGPLAFLVGSDDLPQTLQDALLDKEPGDEVTIQTAAGDVFGDYNPDGIVPVPRTDLPDDISIEVGTEIGVSIEDDDGRTEELPMRVHEINADTILLDANHPLAGKALRVWMRVEEVAER